MERDIQPADTYVRKLSTLLPAEVTGLYLFLRSLTQQNQRLYPWLAAAVVIIAALLLAFGSTILHVSKLPIKILYCITFFLWVISIEIFVLADMFDAPNAPIIVAGAVAIWTFALPSIFDRVGR